MSYHALGLAGSTTLPHGAKQLPVDNNITVPLISVCKSDVLGEAHLELLQSSSICLVSSSRDNSKRQRTYLTMQQLDPGPVRASRLVHR